MLIFKHFLWGQLLINYHEQSNFPFTIKLCTNQSLMSNLSINPNKYKNKIWIIILLIIRKAFVVPNKIHRTNMLALTYTISQGISKWSAKIVITGLSKPRKIIVVKWSKFTCVHPADEWHFIVILFQKLFTLVEILRQ